MKNIWKKLCWFASINFAIKLHILAFTDHNSYIGGYLEKTRKNILYFPLKVNLMCLVNLREFASTTLAKLMYGIFLYHKNINVCFL